MIELKDVSFSYTHRQQVLKNINLTIQKGECVLLCGKSGSGKTTITRLINGLIPDFYEDGSLSGQILVDGERTTSVEMYELAKKVGSVFQNPKTQFFNLDSEAELAFGLENSGVPKEVILQRLEVTTENLEIESLRNRNIFAMSAGEKQRLAFASVYAMNPDIYVLDEPTANLDDKSIELLKQNIIRIKNEGKTIVIAEHRIYFLLELIDRAVFMEQGEITQEFTRMQFLELSDETRKEMGLRSIRKPNIDDLISVNDCTNCDLVVSNLSCSIRGNEVIRDFNLSTKRGEVLGIVGLNGSGKTTLLRCIAGLLKPTSGEILLDGNVLKNKKRNRACYLIMQDVNHQLFSESVWYECELSDVTVNKEEITTLLQEYELFDLRNNHPMALSGGQKQRLAIATGILCGKNVILFDEPTSGLDYKHMLSVSSTIKALAKRGHIVIIVTHDNELIECTCDRVQVLDKNINSSIHERNENDNV
jgi:energy-coupling factor transport system ATP-binding protein